MPHYKDQNNANNTVLGTAYHETESFIYVYRWWIVLVLASFVLVYYYTKSKCGGESDDINIYDTISPKLTYYNYNHQSVDPSELFRQSDGRLMFNTWHQ